MLRPVITVATIASVALIAAPAFAQMRMSGAGSKMLSYGVHAGYGTDWGQLVAGPEFGLNLHFDLDGPVNLNFAPRYQLGIGADGTGKNSQIFIPLTIRPMEISNAPALFGGIGPFLTYGFGGDSTYSNKSLGYGALLEAGVSLPMSGFTVELGGEFGYGFGSPAASDSKTVEIKNKNMPIVWTANAAIRF